MTATATERVVALPNGSARAGADSPPVRRTRTRARVDDTPRSHKARAFAARARRASRHTIEVVYLDAADSWWLNGQSPSLRQVAATDYGALAVAGYAPFRWWCRGWKVAAVVSAAGLDTVKFFLVHPVRGPLFLTSVGVAAGVIFH